MTGADIRKARTKLAKLWGLDRPLKASELGRILGLQGRDPGATVLEWESGAYAPSGPVSIALEMMLSTGVKPSSFEGAFRSR